MVRDSGRARLSFAHAVAVLVVLTGCKEKPAEPAKGQASNEMKQASGVRAPAGEFRVGYDLPPKAGAAPLNPPEVALAPWKVWINQERPRQKKNPEWQEVPAKTRLELTLASDGHFRCVLQPVSLFAHQESETDLKYWTATRSVLCSSDDWRTFIETTLRVDVSPDGSVMLPPETRPSALLHDTIGAEKRETVVALAFSAERSTADAGSTPTADAGAKQR